MRLYEPSFPGVPLCHQTTRRSISSLAKEMGSPFEESVRVPPAENVKTVFSPSFCTLFASPFNKKAEAGCKSLATSVALQVKCISPRLTSQASPQLVNTNPQSDAGDRYSTRTLSPASDNSTRAEKSTPFIRPETSPQPPVFKYSGSLRAGVHPTPHNDISTTRHSKKCRIFISFPPQSPKRYAFL